MIDEKIKNRIGELRNLGLSISEIANALKVSESTVKRYCSDDYEEENDDITTSTKKKSLNVNWMTMLFGDEWKNDIELMQLFFNFNQLADKTERDLYDFLKVIYNIISQYYRHSDTPLKLFDIFMDISSNMTFLEDGYDVEEFTKIFEDFYDKCVFIKDLEKDYGSIEEFKESKEEEIEEIRVENDSRFEKLAKISNQLKEINQVLSDENIKAKTLLINQGSHYKEKIKEIMTENQVLKQLLIEFEHQYPKEIKEFVDIIKSREVNEIQHSEKAIS